MHLFFLHIYYTPPQTRLSFRPSCSVIASAECKRWKKRLYSIFRFLTFTLNFLIFIFINFRICCGWIGNTLVVWSAGLGFDCRPRGRLPWKYFMFFFRSSAQICDITLNHWRNLTADVRTAIPMTSIILTTTKRHGRRNNLQYKSCTCMQVYWRYESTYLKFFLSSCRCSVDSKIN
jgi:hypothetical protein